MTPPPPRGFCKNSFKTKNIKIKFWLIVNGLINNKSVDFYKIEHCPYMREREGVYFRDI